jgi:isopentenyl-diphosphate delta-isomerase
MKDQEFINRKADHIRYSLSKEAEAVESGSLHEWNLIHDSLPDLNLGEVSLETDWFGTKKRNPFFIAGMTAGHPDARLINERLARAASERGWAMGLGSQRRELDSDFKDSAVEAIRQQNPGLFLISNLGIAQLIEVYERASWNSLQEMLERSGASALAIHLNPLQEAIQPEGTPRFKNGWRALKELFTRIKMPLVLKETGSGMSRIFSERVASMLRGSVESKTLAVDVSGLGGTHWGRVEGLRAGEGTLSHELGATFANWGVPVAESILNARSAFSGSQQTTILASGGIRTGLDAAKCLALGAHAVGFAKPALEAALQGDRVLQQWMEKIESELRVAMFCTGSGSIGELGAGKIERRNS